MSTKKLEISHLCRLEASTYESMNITDVSLDYVERSNSHWGSDTEVSIKIDANMARKIIDFLRDAHGIDA